MVALYNPGIVMWKFKFPKEILNKKTAFINLFVTNKAQGGTIRVLVSVFFLLPQCFTLDNVALQNIHPNPAGLV